MGYEMYVFSLALVERGLTSSISSKTTWLQKTHKIFPFHCSSLLFMSIITEKYPSNISQRVLEDAVISIQKDDTIWINCILTLPSRTLLNTPLPPMKLSLVFSLVFESLFIYIYNVLWLCSSPSPSVIPFPFPQNLFFFQHGPPVAMPVEKRTFPAIINV